MIIRTFLGAIVLTGLAGTAGASGGSEVSRGVVVDAPAAEVWEAVGPFCAISDWHPAIATCTEEDVDGRPHRRLTTGDGAEFLEERLSHDDEAMSYRYTIVESPLPVSDYESSLSVSETEEGTLITWTGAFEPDGVSPDEAAEIVGGIYDAGIDSIQKQVAE